MSDKLALIVGGAEGVWGELKTMRTTCDRLGLAYDLFVINDMISEFSEVAIGVTLHPDKLGRWLAQRNSKMYPPLSSVWTHRHYKGIVASTTPDWGGSSGLFAVKIAIQLGHYRVIGCGVPITVSDKHFLRHEPWAACAAFQKAWVTRGNAIRPYFRSTSGWTAETFGRPTPEWLTEGRAAA